MSTFNIKSPAVLPIRASVNIVYPTTKIVDPPVLWMRKKHGQERDAVADIKKDKQKIGRELEKERGTRERKKYL